MNIKEDSRKIQPGDTFIALRKQNDGHNYVEQAIQNGATTVIVEEGLYDVETVVVPDTHDYLVNYLKDHYYYKIKDLKLIGMTGTNGKTTTCFLIYQALKKLNCKVAYIGTIGFYMDEKVRDLNNTTPDILEIYEMLLECKKNKIEYVVMEVSSHSLSMHRVEGLSFMYGIFSNLTQDHLDYHKTMANYASAKQKLFDMVACKTFVNIDDKYKDLFLKDNSVTYGFGTSDYQVTDYKISLHNTEMKVDGVWYKTSLIGKHNIYNILVVISVLKELGYHNIQTIVEDLIAPPGRMDMIKKDSNVIIVDYAHTPDAVLKIIDSCKELHPKHIYTILGCGGDRDKTKRPIMGKIACENSDYAIFTSDNPRSEDPREILKDMVQSLDNKNYEIVINREKAIEKGIQILVENDILLVLGKGHETYQMIGNIKYDFDDKQIVNKYI